MIYRALPKAAALRSPAAASRKAPRRRSSDSHDKKSWVITKTKEYCIRNGIAYDDELIDSTLESLIEFSKRVNAPDEKKEEVAVEESTVTNVKSAGGTQAPAEKEIKING